MARSFTCSMEQPVVETVAGKLRGYALDGVYTFHGIQYAAANRFQMPAPVAPWEGVADATNYGYVCPVNGAPAPKGEIYIPHRFWPANEHCQYLNVWTTSLDREAKKPVMVWLHGGGYSDGSSIEQVAYEGDALAAHGDVVVVTINHRLNILGFLDMSSFGPQYYNSANAGIADIVEALRWVHQNIAVFGGDPENVTIFGQSGGGGKVQTLMQTPAAAGLFHKAILMSGIMETPKKAPADHRPLIEGMLKELGIGLDEAEELEKVPYDVLIRAFNRVHIRLLKQGTFISWEPRPNDWYVGDPMVVGFTDYAKKVPTMAGSVIAEFSGAADSPDTASMSREEKLALLRERFGEAAEELVGLFEKAYPDKDIAWLSKLDTFCRPATTRFIERKAQVSEAPAYLYLFSLDFDVKGPRPAWHCADIPFIFHNSHRVPCCNMAGATEKIETEMCDAWVSFARSGNPNHPNLSDWPAYEDSRKYTMVFDRESAARSDYDRVLLQKVMDAAPAKDFQKVFIQNALKAEEDGNGRAWIY